jgi:2-(1,2-epoxy-1,2-dihydrophenyl)acetyl-CoA isomerase
MCEEFKDIIYEEKGQVAWVTLNRPATYNAFTPVMNREVTVALKKANQSDAIRAIVLTGTGRAFCSGEDLDGVTVDTDHGAILRARYHPMMQAMKQVEKPIIAAVNGTAAGAGMSLALAADFRLVHENAKFVSAFLGVGLIPDSGFLYQLPRMIGYAKALELAVLGKPLSAEDAQRCGLVTEVFAADEWEDGVASFSMKLAALPTKAIGLIKRLMIDGMNEGFLEVLEKEAQAQRIAGQSADHREGLEAFKQSRPPMFTGL